MSVQQAGEEHSLRERKKLATRAAIHEAALHLVDGQGLDATTIDQICQRAEVSTRTFFNYFPSKASAALGLPEEALPTLAAERFRSGDGQVVGDLCRLMADAFAAGGEDRRRMKELVARRPELQPAFGQWLGELRSELFDLVAARSRDRDEASAAIALVLGALTTIAHDDSDPDVPMEARLRGCIQTMAVLAATV